MESWREELYHYGIKGMKWGVRRYQNPDGSLTPAGRKRYSGGKRITFAMAKKNVKSKLSNSPKEYRELPINIDTVAKRGKLSKAEAIECSNLATDIFSRASSAEPAITDDILSIANRNGIDMYGLSNRLKQPTSIAAKIGADAKEKDISFTEASHGIKDAIRYTTVSSNSNFVSNYNKLKKKLEKKGYSEEVCKNYFEMYNMGLCKHKSVQSTFKSPDGYLFEMQFQTLSSQAAKELKIPIYEKRRQAGLTDAQKRDLERQMDELAMQVKDPDDILTIKTHK